MKYGDIFRSMFDRDPQELSAKEVKDIALKNKEIQYKDYGENVVTKRGNIFENKNLNIDALLDKSLEKSLI